MVAYISDPSSYQRLVGRPIYLTITQPNLAYAVHVLSQSMDKPRVPHLEAAHHVLHYVKQTPSEGIFLPTTTSIQLNAFCDAGWARCHDTRRFVTGHCLFLGNSLISWKNKKQTTVSWASAKAEYWSMAATCCEITRLKYILQDLGIKHSHPANLYCENQASLHFASNLVFHEQTKHIEIDCHLIQEKVQEGMIKMNQIYSKSWHFHKAVELLTILQISRQVRNYQHTFQTWGGVLRIVKAIDASDIWNLDFKYG